MPGLHRRCYHHNRNETADHWPGPGHRDPRSRESCRPAHRVRRSNQPHRAIRFPRRRCRFVPGSRRVAGLTPRQLPRKPASQHRCRVAQRRTRRRPPRPRSRRLPSPPFGRVGGTLWLEVSGVFFLLPVVVFTPTVWHARASWLQGPEHRTFWVSAVVVLIFFYLGISSFWRARRR